MGGAEEQAPAISIGPNPCDGLLTITAAQDAGGMDISLLDALGRPVLRSRMKGSMETLDLHDQPCGAYLLKLRSAGGVRTERIVLQ